MENIAEIAKNWVLADSEEATIDPDYYCSTRDIFQARLDTMSLNLSAVPSLSGVNIYLLAAIAGEIGNNSFDHNGGNWPDIAGVFFGYTYTDQDFAIVLADRGQGVLKSLQKVKSELVDEKEALEVAFTQKISGRAPENRGNGLKFVKESLRLMNLHLLFSSGTAQAVLNQELVITNTNPAIEGCFSTIRRRYYAY